MREKGGGSEERIGGYQRGPSPPCPSSRARERRKEGGSV